MTPLKSPEAAVCSYQLTVISPPLLCLPQILLQPQQGSYSSSAAFGLFFFATLSFLVRNLFLLKIFSTAYLSFGALLVGWVHEDASVGNGPVNI